MKKLLGDKYSTFDQDIFKQMYYQRLPTTIQSNLFSVKNKLDIDEPAKLADEFMTLIPATPVNAVKTHDNDQLASLVSNLTLQVNAMRQELYDLRSSSRPRSSSRDCHHYR